MDLLKYYAESEEAYKGFMVEKFTGSRGRGRECEPEPVWITNRHENRMIRRSGPISKALAAKQQIDSAKKIRHAISAAQGRVDTLICDRERIWVKRWIPWLLLPADLKFKYTGFAVRMPAVYPPTPEHLRMKRRPKISEIIESVAKYYNVSALDIISDRRTTNIVKPRQEIMALARCLTSASLPAIGAKLGGRDHTTVLHGARKVMAQVGFGPDDATNPKFADWCAARYDQIKAANRQRALESRQGSCGGRNG